MEEFLNSELAVNIAIFLGGVLTTLAVMGLGKIKAFILKTETQLDDKALLPIVEAVIKALEEKKDD